MKDAIATVDSNLLRYTRVYVGANKSSTPEEVDNAFNDLRGSIREVELTFVNWNKRDKLEIKRALDTNKIENNPSKEYLTAVYNGMGSYEDNGEDNGIQRPFVLSSHIKKFGLDKFIKEFRIIADSHRGKPCIIVIVLCRRPVVVII